MHDANKLAALGPTCYSARVKSERERVAASVAWIRRRSSTIPAVGIILGSGLGGIAERFAPQERWSTSAMPDFPVSTAPGHLGELIFGRVGERAVTILSGRVHGYEGHEPVALGFGVRVLRALGCSDVILTNAAGGLNSDFHTGDIMLVDDHVSLPGLVGRSPLSGAEMNPDLTRFVDLTEAYDPALRAMAASVAVENEICLQRGVYVMVGGPQYETPAEVRFLRSVGGDAVGMSTVPEVIVARQLGMRVMALSVISNPAAGLLAKPITHEQVLESVKMAADQVGTIIVGVIMRSTA